MNTQDLSTHCTHSLHPSLTLLTLLPLSVVESGCTASQRYPCSRELWLSSGTVHYQSPGACFVLNQWLWLSIAAIMYQSIPPEPIPCLFSLIALFFCTAILIVIFFFFLLLFNALSPHNYFPTEKQWQGNHLDLSHIFKGLRILPLSSVTSQKPWRTMLPFVSK